MTVPCSVPNGVAPRPAAYRLRSAAAGSFCALHTSSSLVGVVAAAPAAFLQGRRLITSTTGDRGLSSRARAPTRLAARAAGFEGLGLSAEVLGGARALEWREATEVQRQAIPALLRGDDVWVEAPTGSGKTAAFALPVLQRLSASAAGERRRPRGRYARALVLCPTRELAVQTADVFASLGGGRERRLGLRTTVATGGVSINPVLMSLGRGGTDVLVATPGRLLDVLDKNGVSLDRLEVLVLDEADKLLGAEFKEELDAILALLPPLARVQTALFSATFPFRTRPKAEALMTSAAVSRIRCGPDDDEDGAAAATSDDEEGSAASDRQQAAGGAMTTTMMGAPNIEHRAVRVDAPRRTQLLVHLRRAHGWDRMLVFVGSQYKSEQVAKKLRRQRIAAAALHGGLSQGSRRDRLADFRESHLEVLVVTDVAARGIDVAALPAVVNFDLPRSAATYKHRVGRVGRAGLAGVAVSFVSRADEPHFRLIEKRQEPPLPRLRREIVQGFEPAEQDGAPADGNQRPRPEGAPAGAEEEDASTTGVPGVKHSRLGLAHDRMHGGVKGRRKSKKDKLREKAAAEAASKAGA